MTHHTSPNELSLKWYVRRGFIHKIAKISASLSCYKDVETEVPASSSSLYAQFRIFLKNFYNIK